MAIFVVLAAQPKGPSLSVVAPDHLMRSHVMGSRVRPAALRPGHFYYGRFVPAHMMPPRMHPPTLRPETMTLTHFRPVAPAGGGKHG